uniref:Integrase catalytic domain-containing protein n=1 Tax=Phlebotomus papatasi TaxID=29031 RepID=A0A1B0DGT8_PHLPP
MDYFTKWPELFPLVDQSAVEVADALVNQVVCRFGVPREIHSDQGRNFESELVAEVMKVLGMERTRTTPLHPQSDGMVERANRTIMEYLSKFVQDNQSDWDVLLPLFGLAYRSAMHESTVFTPAVMMLGRELRLPVDLKYGKAGNAEEPVAYRDELRRRLDIIHESATELLKKTANCMKIRYDRSARPRGFQVDDKVWVYNPKRRRGRSPKLQSNWEGPYTIVERRNDVVFRIRNDHGRFKVVHIDRLAPYRGVLPDRDDQT